MSNIGEGTQTESSFEVPDGYRHFLNSYNIKMNTSWGYSHRCLESGSWSGHGPWSNLKISNDSNGVVMASLFSRIGTRKGRKREHNMGHLDIKSPLKEISSSKDVDGVTEIV